MQRWVGLGVIADNLIQIGRYLVLQHYVTHAQLEEAEVENLHDDDPFHLA